MSSEDKADRKIDVSIILKIMGYKELGDMSVRPRKTPKLNLNATILKTLITWKIAECDEPCPLRRPYEYEEYTQLCVGCCMLKKSCIDFTWTVSLVLGYMQVPYLQIWSMPQVQYLQIRSKLHVQYLQKGYMISIMGGNLAAIAQWLKWRYYKELVPLNLWI